MSARIDTGFGAVVVGAGLAVVGAGRGDAGVADDRALAEGGGIGRVESLSANELGADGLAPSACEQPADASPTSSTPQVGRSSLRAAVTSSILP